MSFFNWDANTIPGRQQAFAPIGEPIRRPMVRGPGGLEREMNRYARFQPTEERINIDSAQGHFRSERTRSETTPEEVQAFNSRFGADDREWTPADLTTLHVTPVRRFTPRLREDVNLYNRVMAFQDRIMEEEERNLMAFNDVNVATRKRRLGYSYHNPIDLR